MSATTNSKSKTGRIGETLAATFLEKVGLQIFARNFHAPGGEIDLVAICAAARRVHFVEVKTRRTNFGGFPEESVNFRKQQKIRQTALHWLRANPEFADWEIGFDVVAVTWLEDQSEIKWLEDAF